MAKGNKQVAVRMANEFRIWAAAKSVNWDCTMHDLAEETGLSYLTVGNVCRRRGWVDRLKSGVIGGDNRNSVDVMMSGTMEGKRANHYW